MLILHLAGVGRAVWGLQTTALTLAVLVSLARLPGSARLWMGVTVIGAAAPLLGHGHDGPQRWLALGPLHLYIAPVVLPTGLVACARLARRGGAERWWAAAGVATVAALLAAQPDASQALAWLAGATVACWRSGLKAAQWTLALAGAGLATAWAFSQPDPLMPVAHVEGVFALAWQHSPLLGGAVVAAAVAWVLGLAWQATRGGGWLAAVAAYEAALFGGSVLGSTPAPLIGYGAGPLLGYGLMVATTAALARRPWAGRLTAPSATRPR